MQFLLLHFPVQIVVACRMLGCLILFSTWWRLSEWSGIRTTCSHGYGTGLLPVRSPRTPRPGRPESPIGIGFVAFRYQGGIPQIPTSEAGLDGDEDSEIHSWCPNGFPFGGIRRWLFNMAVQYNTYETGLLPGTWGIDNWNPIFVVRTEIFDSVKTNWDRMHSRLLHWPGKAINHLQNTMRPRLLHAIYSWKWNYFALHTFHVKNLKGTASIEIYFLWFVCETYEYADFSYIYKYQ